MGRANHVIVNFPRPQMSHTGCTRDVVVVSPMSHISSSILDTGRIEEILILHQASVPPVHLPGPPTLLDRRHPRRAAFSQSPD